MPLLSISDLVVHLPSARGTVHAVNGIDLTIDAGETVGLIGESGCGKSTLGKAIMRIVPATSGRITLDGTDITTLSGRHLHPHRAKAQMVFQDATGALNPRRRVGASIGQPLTLAGWPARRIDARVAELLEQVGLSPASGDRFPNEFSGGQRQRIGIARALALGPKLVICDEPVSALDVSVRAQVINLMMDLREKLGIAYLFISHDLTVVEHIADRIVVMYLGRAVETGRRANFWREPLHPYTRALVEAAPVADPRLARERSRPALEGDLPSPLHLPAGCAFHTRCPLARDICRSAIPKLKAAPNGNRVACHLVEGSDVPAAGL